MNPVQPYFSQSAEPLLADGLHLPRPELVRSIVDAPSARVVIVRAAAGFGKSALLHETRSSAVALGHSVFWVSLTPQDNDVDRFVAHLWDSMHLLRRQAGLPGIASGNGGLEFISTLRDQPQPFSIVLDDFETIDDPVVLSLVQQLLDAIPPSGRLLIASRNAPRLNLGRLRARGHLLEIGHGLLRFTIEELQAYLRLKRKLLISDASIASLHRKTEGWPAAIYLASISLKESKDTAAAVAAFSGSHLELAQFLAEDVFDRLDPGLRDFMLKTSMFQQMSGPLCDAALQIQGAGAILEDLQQQNLFISRADNDGHWYRHHSLFASFLRGRLDREVPGAASKLSHAAASWYLAHGFHIWAVEQLLSSGAIQEAVETMEAHAIRMQERGRTRLLVRWFDRIGVDLAAARPRLAMVLAWALLFNRRYGDTRALMEETLQRCGDRKQRLRVEIELRALRCVKLAMSERVQEASDEETILREMLPADADYQRAAIANAIAFAMIALNRYGDARSQLRRASVGNDSDTDIMRPIRVVVEAIIDLTQGRLGDGLARLEASRSVAHLDGQRNAAAEGKPSLDVLRALAYYEVGRLGECAEALAQALPYAKSYVSDDSLIISHVLSARLAWIDGDRKTCLRVLAEMEQLGRRSSSQRVVCSAWLERSRLSLMDGQRVAAEDALRAAESEATWASTGLFFYANDVETPFVCRARLQIVRGDIDGLAPALVAAIEQARANSRHRRALSLGVLHAAVLNREGKRDEARAMLQAVLRDASHEGYARCLLDEAVVLGDLKPWLDSARVFEATAAEKTLAFMALLRTDGQQDQRAAAASGMATDGAEPVQESLSTRELQVLRLLETGLRNKAIADRLSLSEFTVKSHLRNINAKLGAGARTEAVAIARARGLLPQ